ncbi:MAG: AAA family ATPase, partial [Geminicoccaceae bacterium]
MIDRVQLTRLRLRGFKSFCDPTELEIAPGTTGIVGPNGCGKSNLVDALRWVMGEGSPKGLRGAEMDDVIFAGSAARPPLDVAEVALGVQGPVEGPLVLAPGERAEILRRIVRGQGSTWRIDGRDVRQRDVHHLLADAAAGARGASIVGQGQIALVVDSRPDERRRLLEEAAGIAGLQARRREAEIKLQQTRANLERVRDLLASRAARLEELARQAEQAERYRRISAEIRAVEATLLLRRHGEAAAAARAAQAAVEAATAVEAEARAALEAARAERSALALERAAAQGRLEQAAGEAARLAERLVAAEARAARARAEREERARRLAEAEADLDALRAERARLAEELAEREREALELEREQAASAAAAAEQAERLRVVRTVEEAAAAARAQALATRLELGGVERLRAERAQLEARLAAETDPAGEAAAAAAVEAARVALGAALGELEAAEARERAAVADAAAIDVALAEAREALATLAERRAALIAARQAAEAAERARTAARRERAERRALLERTREQLDARSREIETRLAACEAALARGSVAALEEAVSEAAAAARGAAEEATRAAQAVERAEAELRAAQAEASEARAAAARIEAEAATLEALLAELGSAEPIARSIGGTEGLEAALAAALGDDLTAGTDPGAARYWRELEGGPALPPLPEGVPPLSERLRAPPLLARRLSQIGLCDGETAERLQARLAPGQRLVSPEGGLWRWDGFVRRPGADEASLRLARLARLEAVERDRARARAACERAQA